MYTTSPTSEKVALWTSDIMWKKVKIFTSEAQEAGLLTLNWAPDNFHLSFSQASKLYTVGADGSGLRQLPSMAGMNISNAVWSPDQKSVYVSAAEDAQWYTHTIWKWSDGSNPEKLVEKCGYAYESTPAENTCSRSSHSEKRRESMRCPFLKGNVYRCFQALRAALF